MKKITLLFGLALIVGLLALNNNVQGQAYVNMDETAYLAVGADVVPSTFYLQVVTPSGNIKVQMTFYLPTTNPIVPDHGVFKFPAGFYYNGVFLWDKNITINSNGKVHINLKYNGSSS